MQHLKLIMQGKFKHMMLLKRFDHKCHYCNGYKYLKGDRDSYKLLKHLKIIST